MKSSKLIVAALTMLALGACTGPAGPQGMTGNTGQRGDT